MPRTIHAKTHRGYGPRGCTDETLFPFGKHEGKPLKDVPDDYLEWLYNQKWSKEWLGVYNYIVRMHKKGALPFKDTILRKEDL